MTTQPDPNQFSRDAWEANAKTWDERMGDEGNDFFKTFALPKAIRQILILLGLLSFEIINS